MKVKADRDKFVSLLNEFVTWSQEPGRGVEHAADYGQAVVAFRRSSDRAVLWSAYPREDGGAKLELLPGKSAVLPAATRAAAISMIQPWNETTIGPESKLMIPFLKLKTRTNRASVLQFMAGLLP